MINRGRSQGGRQGPKRRGAGDDTMTFLIFKKTDFVPPPKTMMGDNFFNQHANSVLIMYLKWRFQAMAGWYHPWYLPHQGPYEGYFTMVPRLVPDLRGANHTFLGQP